jgi:hypothetical protein
MLENGNVTWDNEFKMAEERRDALPARSTALRDSAYYYINRDSGHGSRITQIWELFYLSKISHIMYNNNINVYIL